MNFVEILPDVTSVTELNLQITITKSVNFQLKLWIGKLIKPTILIILEWLQKQSSPNNKCTNLLYSGGTQYIKSWLISMLAWFSQACIFHLHIRIPWA